MRKADKEMESSGDYIRGHMDLRDILWGPKDVVSVLLAHAPLLLNSLICMHLFTYRLHMHSSKLISYVYYNFH